MSLAKLTGKQKNQFSMIGAILYISSIQYFIIQFIVARKFAPSYSLTQNTISDLGNTSCGWYRHMLVCSQWPHLMDISFIVLGVTMIIGSILLFYSSVKTKLSFIGFSFMALSGLGSIIVGFFPENTVATLHILGATLIFLIGNIAIILIGLSKRLSLSFRYYSLITGLLTLIALVFFISNTYLGIGEGGMERIVVYPQTIWLIVFGINRVYRINIKT